MLSRIQYLVEGIFQSSSRIFHRAGLTPNSLTVLGFLLWVEASSLYWGGLSGWEWGAAVVVLLVASFLDAVDGAMARKYAKVSKFGGVLDSVFDRLGEIAVYAGLAAGALISFWLALWAMSASFVRGSDFGDSEVDCTGDAQVLHDSLARNVSPSRPQLLSQRGLDKGHPRSNSLHLVPGR